jgi:hypothetical protein
MALPTIKQCILCEDIRVERRHLFSLMGIYGATPWIQIKIRDFNLPVGVAAVFFGGEGEGTSTFRAEIRTSNGKTLISTSQPETSQLNIAPGRSFICGFRINATYPGHGLYRIVLWGDDQVLFDDSFMLEQGSGPDFQ